LKKQRPWSLIKIDGMKKLTPSLKKRIEEALNSIRPYLEADGGDARILDLNDEMVLTIEFVGSCGTCPMSTMTLKAGVEESIRRLVPEIKAVDCVNLTSPNDPRAQLPQNMVR
jgi:Fe-S cluster biogenesis protein NfuA